MSSPPLRVLIVEDSPADAKLVVRELHRLGRPVEFERVEELPALRSALERGNWDLVISDWYMPKLNALEALHTVRDLAIDLPFIVVSGTVGEELAVNAMREGANDYVLKDQLTRLEAAVSRELDQHKERQSARQTGVALRSTEVRFQTLWNAGIMGIAVSDPGGTLREANDALLRSLGHSRDTLDSGQLRWSEMTPTEWSDADRTAAEVVRTRGSAPTREKELLRKDGTRISVLVGVTTLDPLSVMTVVTDLSERKRAEKALREMEKQLRLAQKMEAIGLLAGGIAHDFNNILSVILSYSGTLLSDLSAVDPMREPLEEIRLAGQRAATLTHQLLLFSRQEIAEAIPLDLNETVGGMERMIRRILGEDVEVVFLPAPTLDRVLANPGQIEQVIMNLVVNARDAMAGGGKLVLETSNVTLDEVFASQHLGVRPGRHVMLTVSDNGAGMSHEIQARIFEPFFTTKEKGRGTGLGLSTAFGIIRQAGGSVWVYSEVGKGTTFKIYLPRIAEVLPTNPTKRTQPLPQGTETLLLVEDSPPVRVVTRDILRRYGYRVIEASGPSEALQQCEAFPGLIHLVLTDVVMPQMSGPDLVVHLRALRPELKVLCMSGYTDDAVVRNGMLQSGIPFLQKPLTPEALLCRVRDVLDGDS